MNKKIQFAVALLSLFLVGFYSCEPEPDGPGTGTGGTDIPTDTTQITDTTIWVDTAFQEGIPGRIELPEVKNKRWYVEHNYYAMEYDTAQRHSVWVAYVFNSAYNQKAVNRSDKWAFDPIIPREFQSLSSTSQTYGQGYDRGHLVASEDRVFSLEANHETFYFSNMSPQLGAFNQRIWKNLEARVREWAQDASNCDTLYVVTGGAINEGIEVIGKLTERNNVTIPKYYFKALLRRKGNSFDGIAFWMENKYYESTKVTHSYSMSIRDLEEKTGINFFPNLRYAVRENPRLEEEVETSLDVGKWEL